MSESPLMWISFLVVVLSLLALDLGVFNKKDHEISIKESLLTSLFYICMAVLFGLWEWYRLGLDSFAEYMTGFFVEKSLALDNIFLISLIFSSLSIPLKYHHRVLFWGIVGVIVLRGIMIGLGAQIIKQFSWTLEIFAIFMLFTGIKMLFMSHAPVDIENNKLLKFMRKHLNITDQLHEQQFLVYQKDEKTQSKKLFITPLFVALIMIEFIDLIFAADSIPAIFSITQNPYIVYTSNIFATLGLRSLYFALASIIERFYYLKYALAIVLIFIGSKVLIANWFGIHITPLVSLMVTLGLLIGGCIYSIIRGMRSAH